MSVEIELGPNEMAIDVEFSEPANDEVDNGKPAVETDIDEVDATYYDAKENLPPAHKKHESPLMISRGLSMIGAPEQVKRVYSFAKKIVVIVGLLYMLASLGSFLTGSLLHSDISTAPGEGQENRLTKLKETLQQVSSVLQLAQVASPINEPWARGSNASAESIVMETLTTAAALIMENL